jgi:hypothetical protein
MNRNLALPAGVTPGEIVCTRGGNDTVLGRVRMYTQAITLKVDLGPGADIDTIYCDQGSDDGRAGTADTIYYNKNRSGGYQAPDNDCERIAGYHGYGKGFAQWRPADPPPTPPPPPDH